MSPFLQLTGFYYCSRGISYKATYERQNVYKSNKYLKLETLNTTREWRVLYASVLKVLSAIFLNFDLGGPKILGVFFEAYPSGGEGRVIPRFLLRPISVTKCINAASSVKISDYSSPNFGTFHDSPNLQNWGQKVRVLLKKNWRHKNIKFLDKFRTTSQPDGEYLRNETR